MLWLCGLWIDWAWAELLIHAVLELELAEAVCYKGHPSKVSALSTLHQKLVSDVLSLKTMHYGSNTDTVSTVA